MTSIPFDLRFTNQSYKMPRNVQKYFIQKQSSKQNSQQKLDKVVGTSVQYHQ